MRRMNNHEYRKEVRSDNSLGAHFFREYLEELAAAKTPEGKRNVRIMHDALKLAALSRHLSSLAKKVEGDDYLTPEANVVINLTEFVLSKNTEDERRAVQACSKAILERVKKFNQYFASKYE